MPSAQRPASSSTTTTPSATAPPSTTRTAPTTPSPTSSCWPGRTARPDVYSGYEWSGQRRRPAQRRHGERLLAATAGSASTPGREIAAHGRLPQRRPRQRGHQLVGQRQQRRSPSAAAPRLRRHQPRGLRAHPDLPDLAARRAATATCSTAGVTVHGRLRRQVHRHPRREHGGGAARRAPDLHRRRRTADHGPGATGASFAVNATTVLGQNIYVTGNNATLGNWNTGSALLLVLGGLPGLEAGRRAGRRARRSSTSTSARTQRERHLGDPVPTGPPRCPSSGKVVTQRQLARVTGPGGPTGPRRSPGRLAQCFQIVNTEGISEPMKGFRTFLLRGNVVELAVGIVVGAAFTSLVNGFVKAFLTPIVGSGHRGHRVTSAPRPSTRSGVTFPYGAVHRRDDQLRDRRFGDLLPGRAADEPDAGAVLPEGAAAPMRECPECLTADTRRRQALQRLHGRRSGPDAVGEKGAGRHACSPAAPLAARGGPALSGRRAPTPARAVPLTTPPQTPSRPAGPPCVARVQYGQQGGQRRALAVRPAARAILGGGRPAGLPQIGAAPRRRPPVSSIRITRRLCGSGTRRTSPAPPARPPAWSPRAARRRAAGRDRPSGAVRRSARRCAAAGPGPG